MKKKINRREFGKLAGGTALLVPVVGGSELAPLAPSPAGQEALSGLKLTPEQEERVEQARERTARQMRTLRESPLSYDAEPAFVFRVRAAGTKKK